MPTPAFHRLLTAARNTHRVCADLRAFVDFPDDLQELDLVPHHVPAAGLLAEETGLRSGGFGQLRDAFIAAGPEATWRETYRGTDIGDDFLSRFGCYCLIGKGGGWMSAKMASYVVYMPAGLDYGWHHHPAEELYLVLAGEAEFLREGAAPERLGAGGVSRHDSNQPHAMRTLDDPVMAYVVWRNHLNTPPVLTERSVVQGI